MSINRRKVVKGLGAAGLGAATIGLPATVRAQAGPIRLGFLTIKTGPLASGGISMEQGLAVYLKEHDNKLGGRPVELFTADTAGVPANTRSKTQELVERNKVQCIIGPLAAFEALAIDDYIKASQIPTLGVAAAEDMTQRKPNPWFVRATACSAQGSYPMADYAAKELKYKRVAVIADDFAYGHELIAGFQRVFEESGGKVVQKLWPPLTVPDYGTYIAQIKTDVDALFLGFAGSNGFRFIRQFAEYGLKGKIPLIGGMTAIDEPLLANMGDEALGVMTSCWYSGQLDNPLNKKFNEQMKKEFKVDASYYAATTNVSATVLDNALTILKGNVEDKNALMKTLRESVVPDSVRGPVKFDHLGNVVGDFYIRKVERKDGKLVNAVIKTYPNVSQFWTYGEEAFLKNPVYSRDFPPAKNLEN